MKVPDALHLVLLSLAAGGFLVVPIVLRMRYPRMHCRLPHARRICIAYAVGLELFDVVFITAAVSPSVPPHVGDVLVTVALLCIPTAAVMLAYGGYWLSFDHGDRF